MIDFRAEDPVETILRLTDGIGVDRVIDAVGVDGVVARLSRPDAAADVVALYNHSRELFAGEENR